MHRYSYYKTAACTPEVYIGDPQANKEEILKCIQELDKDTQLVVFPELCITGYTCQDLFYEHSLLNKTKQVLFEIVEELPENLVTVLGLPLEIDNKLYNCAAICFNHDILGIQVKTFIPSYNEFYETRWFSSANELKEDTTFTFKDKKVPVSNHIVFKDTTTSATLGIEICEDLWVTIPVSSTHALAGANVLCNLSASNEIISKANYRRNLVKDQSAKCYAGYVYASAGPTESSSDLVFSGHNLICENGAILSETKTDKIIYGQIDLDHLNHDRLHYKTSMQDIFHVNYTTVEFASKPIDEIEFNRFIDAYPFVPNNQEERVARCLEILHIQAQGLATRLSKIHCQDVVIGISGGLDSTLALLVCHEAFKINNYDAKGIHAITMPGFGTTDRTYNNAIDLMKSLGISIREISIQDACIQHFKDIDHDINVHDVTYENSQARERTQILMDIANQTWGMVVGTGDLSELALGWATYNGDHMSMYGVNGSIPKTLVKYLVQWVAENDMDEDAKATLLDIVDTPISPELIPADENGEIKQKTEDLVGPYELHDFFLYYFLRFGFRPSKIYYLANIAFKDVYDKETIKKWLSTFFRRFFNQQFKRSCLPDGPKVGSISISPRGDWRMPSDASSTIWLKEIEDL